LPSYDPFLGVVELIAFDDFRRDLLLLRKTVLKGSAAADPPNYAMEQDLQSFDCSLLVFFLGFYMAQSSALIHYALHWLGATSLNNASKRCGKCLLTLLSPDTTARNVLHCLVIL
jgi:hypothetical protein